MTPQETPIITNGKAMICRGNPIRLGIIRAGLKGGPTCLPLRSPTRGRWPPQVLLPEAPGAIPGRHEA